jgi:hypothetical protein
MTLAFEGRCWHVVIAVCRYALKVDEAGIASFAEVVEGWLVW